MTATILATPTSFWHNLNNSNNITTDDTQPMFKIAKGEKNASGIYDSENLGDGDVFLPWDNPDNIISFDTFNTIEEFFFRFMNPLVFCIGCPVNILNCVVFFRQGLKDRMNLCLFCLALADLLFVTTFTLSGAYFILKDVIPNLSSWWKWSLQKYISGLYRGFLLCSGCLTAIVSVERCVCVFMPLKAASLVTIRTMGCILLATVVGIQLLCVIYPLKIAMKEVTDPVTNDTHYDPDVTQLYRDHSQLFDVLENTVLVVAVPILNFVIVVVATTITVVQLKRVIRWRMTAASSSELTENVINSRQMALVKMLVIVSVIFIMTSSPVVALSVTQSILPDFFYTRRYSNIFLASFAVYLELGMINSSINFFVYFFRSSRFREELKSMRCFYFLQGKDKNKGLRSQAVTSCSLVIAGASNINS